MAEGSTKKSTGGPSKRPPERPPVSSHKASRQFETKAALVNQLKAPADRAAREAGPVQADQLPVARDFDFSRDVVLRLITLLKEG